MLGYFAVYGGPHSDIIRNAAPEGASRRWWPLGRLPHEIAALNAR